MYVLYECVFVCAHTCVCAHAAWLRACVVVFRMLVCMRKRACMYECTYVCTNVCM